MRVLMWIFAYMLSACVCRNAFALKQIGAENLNSYVTTAAASRTYTLIPGNYFRKFCVLVFPCYARTIICLFSVFHRAEVLSQSILCWVCHSFARHRSNVNGPNVCEKVSCACVCVFGSDEADACGMNDEEINVEFVLSQLNNSWNVKAVFCNICFSNTWQSARINILILLFLRWHTHTHTLWAVGSAIELEIAF